MSPHVQRALAAIQVRRYDFAIAQLSQALAIAPNQAYLHCLLAEVHLKKADYAAARRCAFEAIQNDPEWPCGHLIWGWAAVMDAGFESSADPAMRTFASGPLFRFYHARFAAEEALRLNPSNPGNFELRACVAQMLEGPRAMLRFAEAGLALDPDHLGCHYQRSVALRLLGRREEAVGELREALRLFPEQADTHRLLAETHFERGDMTAAFQFAQETLRLNPANGPAETMYWRTLQNRHWLLVPLTPLYWSRVPGFILLADWLSDLTWFWLARGERRRPVTRRQAIVYVVQTISLAAVVAGICASIYRRDLTFFVAAVNSLLCVQLWASCGTTGNESRNSLISFMAVLASLLTALSISVDLAGLSGAFGFIIMMLNNALTALPREWQTRFPKSST